MTYWAQVWKSLLTAAMVLSVFLPTESVRAASLSWTTLTPMPVPRSSAAAGVVNGKIFVLGGIAALETPAVTTSAIMYDPAADSWYQKNDLDAARFAAAGAVVDETVYLIGGAGSLPPLPQNTIVGYNASSGATMPAGILNRARINASAVILNNLLYVVGGSSSGLPGGALDSIEECVRDTAAGVWTCTEKAHLPSPREGAAVVALNGNLLIAGGNDSTGNPTTTVWEFDPADNSFGTRRTLPQPLAGAGFVSPNGNVYLVGGVPDSGNVWSNDILAYEPSSDWWEKVGTLPTSRFAMAVSMVNNTIYAIGGDSGQGSPQATSNLPVNEAAVLPGGIGDAPQLSPGSGPTLAVTPALCDFGQVLSTGRKTLTLTNTGDAELRISGMGIITSGGTYCDPMNVMDVCPVNDFEMFSLAPGSCGSLSPVLAPGASCTIDAAFTPANGGIKTAQYRIDSNDALQPTAVFTMTGAAASSTPALTVNFSGSGSGTVNFSQGWSCSGSCTQTYAIGATVTLTPVAGSGSLFAGWNGCDRVTGTSCEATMNSAKTVGALFLSTSFSPNSFLQETLAFVGSDVSFVGVSPNYPADPALFAVTNGTLYRSSDGGASWNSAIDGMLGYLHVPPPEVPAMPYRDQVRVNTVAVSPGFASDQVLFAGTMNGLYKSVNGGVSWFEPTTFFTGHAVKHLAVSPGYATDQIIFCESDGELFKSMDGGASWIQVYRKDRNGILTGLVLSPGFVTDLTLFSGMDASTTSGTLFGGGVLRSSNGGGVTNGSAAWISLSSGLGSMVIRTLAISPNYGADATLLAWTDGGIYRSTTGGGSWNFVSSLMPGSNATLRFSPAYAQDRTIFASSYSTLYQSVDGGTSWTQLNGDGSLQAGSLAISPGYAANPTLLVGTTTAGIQKLTFVKPGPALFTNPAAVDFGAVVAGGSPVSRPITLVNTGNQPLTVSSIASSGADRLLYTITAGTCSSLTPTIAAGTGCTLTIGFAPTTSGLKNATLAITSNDVSGGTKNIPLAGTGMTGVPLNMGIIGAGHGSVSLSTGGSCTGACVQDLVPETLVILTAAADSESQFSGWTGCEAVIGPNTCGVTMSGARSVTAEFTPLPQFMLTINTDGSGKGTINYSTGGSCTGSCGEIFFSGREVLLTAIADGNSAFSHWSGCDYVTGNIYEQVQNNVCGVSVTQAKNVTANFTAALTVTSHEPADGAMVVPGTKVQATFSDPVNANAFNLNPTTFAVFRTQPMKAIAAAGAHSISIRQDGQVASWGDGAWAIFDPTETTAVATGGFHSVALKSDGTVRAWGIKNFADRYDDMDQLIPGNDHGQATVPAGLPRVTAIAAGHLHTVALTDSGTVVAWGDNGFGQITVPSGLTGVKGIAAGVGHTVALKTNGTVVAWGDNSSGKATVPAALSGVVAIAAGGGHTVALKDNGTVVAWGNNDYGQTTIPAGLSGVVAIAAGLNHTLALKSDGTVVAWGANSMGQNTIPTGLSEVVAVAAANAHSLALQKDGTLVAWGAKWNGETDLNQVRELVAGTLSYDAAARSVTFTPASPLLNGETYHVAISDIQAAWNGEVETMIPPLHSPVRWKFTVASDPILSVTLAGEGTGVVQVAAQPPLSCFSDSCERAYPSGTVIDLSATPSPGSVFVGWEGVCIGSASCRLTMDTGKQVTAIFARSGDMIPPVVTGFIMPPTATSLTVPVDAFAASDNVGVAAYLITESAAPPAPSAGGWSAVKPASFTFSAPGNRYVYAWAKDGAGNVSAGAATVVNITVEDTGDTVAPTINSFVLQPGTSLTVQITALAVQDNVGVSGYLVSESNVPPLPGDPRWTGAPPASFTFGSFGAKSLYVWAKDAAGNVSAGARATCTLLDPAAALDTVITGTPANPAITLPSTFTFISSKADATFECSLDGGSYFACTSPISFGALVNGNHTFSVRSLDGTGKHDDSPASHSWVVSVPIVRLALNSFASIANAYLSSDSGQVLEVKGIEFMEDLHFNRSIAITLKGGFDSGYFSSTGNSVIHGTLTISNGTVTFDNIIIM